MRPRAKGVPSPALPVSLPGGARVRGPAEPFYKRPARTSHDAAAIHRLGRCPRDRRRGPQLSVLGSCSAGRLPDRRRCVLPGIRRHGSRRSRAGARDRMGHPGQRAAAPGRHAARPARGSAGLSQHRGRAPARAARLPSRLELLAPVLARTRAACPSSSSGGGRTVVSGSISTPTTRSAPAIIRRSWWSTTPSRSSAASI